MYGPNVNNNKEFMINFLFPFLAGQIAIRFAFSLSLLQHTLQSLAVSLFGKNQFHKFHLPRAHTAIPVEVYASS